jgi:tight adherence protein B
MGELFELSAKPLLYVGIFLGMLLLFEGIRQVLSKSESVSETRNRRMKMIAKGASTEDLLNLLKPTQNDWILSVVPFFGTLPTVLRQAGLTIKPQTFLTIVAILTLLVTIIASKFVIPAAAFGFSFTLFMLIPIVFVRMAAKKRMSAMERQLPEALDLMARGLIVGHPLNTTISAVASEMVDPIASEFGIMSDQIAYGDELVDAFMEFAERTELEDVRYLAISVAIQNGTGGDLGQVLQTLARVIRNRISMRKRILAISSEGRLTSVFLSLLPIFIFVATSISSPGYYGDVSDDPLFIPFATVVVGLVVANYLVLRRMVDFRF